MQTVLYRKMAVVREMNDNPRESPEGSILKVLAYFDIFQYPLLKSEIRQFMDQAVNEATLEAALKNLLDEKNIFRINEFFSLHCNFLLAENRMLGNLRAEKLLPKAITIGRFLYKFPFVMAIGISGSLSKQFADEKADMDFFVITKPNRLWVARTIMHIFKKFTFLTGRQHFYCMNYYLDETALEAENKNIFTSIEIKTLFPVCGRKVMNDFFTANDWTDEFLPACDFRHQQKADPGRPVFKKFTEWLFDNKVGEWLDNYLMRITTRRWKKKEEKGKCNEKGQMMGLITGKHFARSNPGSFQEKVLTLYSKKLIGLKFQMPQWINNVSVSFEE